MRLYLIAARAENGVIGNGPEIPWRAKGEQLIFKALTFNSWLIVGRKTFESMGKLPDRRFAVVSRGGFTSSDPDVLVFPSTHAALEGLSAITDQAFIAGGGEIYRQMIDQADVLYLTRIHTQAEGDVLFPAIPQRFHRQFEQRFSSNIDYSLEIWTSGDK